ncbi:MAG: ribonuclease HII [Thermoflexales bacterium]|nr:ribonuclease HII [Thermoflexales bacterium]
MRESLPVKPAPFGETPTLEEESNLLACGYRRIAGLDEAGRGAWAGPVYAAAVVLPLDRPDLLEVLSGVRDSKQLSPHQRETLSRVIRDVALAVGVGWAEVEEIEGLGILPATRLAMSRAVQQLSVPVDALLIDYVCLPDVSLPQRSLPQADVRCLSVAAASIIAKVERDRRMVELDREYPGYGFAGHKGYGTPQHRRALQRLGVSPLHRRTWRPVARLATSLVQG